MFRGSGCHIKVLTSPGKYEFITPKAEWQTVRLKGLQPEDFKVAQDLFLIDLRLTHADVAAQNDKQ